MRNSSRCVAWAAVVWAVLASALAGEVDDAATRIGAFNIQVFGQSKMDKPDVVAVLVRVLGGFDLTAVQEIRDISQTALPELVDALNADAAAVARGSFTSVVGPRVGRTSSKEQYALVYRASRVTVKDWYTFEDEGDVFEREPLVALLEMDAAGRGKVDVVLVVVHTKPGSDVTYVELDRLADVHDGAKARWGTENAILMGDFNADCSYMPNYRWDAVRLWTMSDRYMWLLDHDADTTTSNSHCAYDRIVLAGDDVRNMYVNASATVLDFKSQLGLTDELTSDVSDHYPVFLDLSATAPWPDCATNRSIPLAAAVRVLNVEAMQGVCTYSSP